MVNKIEEIEILRAFAILGVVAIHVNDIIPWDFNILFLGPVRPLVQYGYIQNILRSSIRIFVLISGVVLGLKYRNDYSVVNFYKKRALSIIPQYLLFSFIYIFYYGYPITASQVMGRLLTGTATPVFWFFILIIYLYIIYPLLIIIIDGNYFKNKPLIFLICILLAYFCWEFFRSDITSLAHTESAFITKILTSMIKMEFLYHLVFFVLGIYISSNFQLITGELKKQKYIYNFSLIIIMFIIFKQLKTVYNIPDLYSDIKRIVFMPLLQLAYIYFFYRASIILIDKTKWLKRMAILIGQYSFGIFLIHMLVLYEIKKALYSFDSSFIYKKEFYLSANALTVFFSIVILKLISFLPYREFVIGGSMRKNRNVN